MTESARSGIGTPWRRTADEIADGIRAWASATLAAGHDADVTDVRMPGSGMANDTILFRLSGEPLVARLAPARGTPYPTFPTFDLDLQRDVIELVRARTAVPVPEIVHHERSDAWLGVPFLITRALDGAVASDNPPYLIDPNGWFRRGGPDDWARMERSTIALVAQVHRIPDGDDTAFLRPLTPGDTALARQFSYQQEYYEWARDGLRIPILERALEVLGTSLPPTARSVVNWGDGRPGNVLYRDFEPVGALDWEMATVGPPEVDVAWLTFFQRFWESMARSYGIPEVPAMFDRDATAAGYEGCTGERLEDLAWYEAFAGLRLGIILARMNMRNIAFGQAAKPADPDGHVVFAALLGELLDRIG